MAQIKDMGRNALPCVADVTDPQQVTGMVEASVSALGALDAMVANAGIAQVKALLDLTAQDFERMFRVNVFGVFNCYSAAARQMVKQGNGGKIIGAARFVAVGGVCVCGPSRSVDSVA